jgi:hypothetical protein
MPLDFKIIINKTPQRYHLPGLITPSGTDIKKIKENANAMDDNISKRKHSHSIALSE